MKTDFLFGKIIARDASGGRRNEDVDMITDGDADGLYLEGTYNDYAYGIIKDGESVTVSIRQPDDVGLSYFSGCAKAMFSEGEFTGSLIRTKDSRGTFFTGTIGSVPMDVRDAVIQTEVRIDSIRKCEDEFIRNC